MFPAIIRGLSRGVALREIPMRAANADHPWLADFQASLQRADLAPATVAGYLKDVRLFLRWHAGAGEFPALREGELIAYRQHLIAQRRLRPGDREPAPGGAAPPVPLGAS